MSNRAARALLVVVSVVSMSVASAAPAAAVTIRWGWVVARHPMLASYTPAAVDQGNSSSGTNSVARADTGVYVVDLGGLATVGGDVQVSVLGSIPRYCAVGGWALNGAALEAEVDCYDLAGAAADSRFVLDFVETNSSSIKFAYLWADQPSITTPYAPNSTYSYNSSGSPNEVTRLSTGSYLVNLGDLASDRGNVQVSAFGNGGAVQCRGVRWFDDTGAEIVKVRCRDTAGALVDSRFNLVFMQGTGLKAVYPTKGAYLWANHPTTASYQPDSDYRWSSQDTIPTVTRSSVGVYSVEILGMGIGGAALVTPTGKRKQRCIVSSIRTDAPPQRIGVRCFDTAGAPIDAAFSLAYVK